MFLKPAVGRKIRDPITRLHLPEEGKEVAESPYWTRRILQGDVTAENVQADGVTPIQIPEPVLQIPKPVEIPKVVEKSTYKTHAYKGTKDDASEE